MLAALAAETNNKILHAAENDLQSTPAHVIYAKSTVTAPATQATQ